MHNREYISLIRYVVVTLVLIAFGFLILAGSPVFMVDPGFAGIHLRLASVHDVKLSSGYYFKYPFIDRVIPIDMRIKKSVIKTEAFSKDLQTVDIEVAINYRIKDPLALYQDIGLNYEQIVIDPFTQESVKAVIAMFTAEELTQHRNKAKEYVKEDLKKALEQVNITLIDFNFIHADFQQEFIRAVEQKQISEQHARQAKFYTETVKEEAQQVRERADAEAYAMSVKKDAVTPKLALLKAIEKWDGRLPRIMTAADALLNIPSKE